MFYAKDGDRVLIAASFAGSGVPPGWYLNLCAHPEVRATIDGRAEPYRAHTLSNAEAEVAWPKLIAVYPTFARYRQWARRTIPVVELRHIADDAPGLNIPDARSPENKPGMSAVRVREQ